jgi:hypothetical protein
MCFGCQIFQIFWFGEAASIDFVEKTDLIIIELMMRVANLPFISLRLIRGQGGKEKGSSYVFEDLVPADVYVEFPVSAHFV